MPSNTKGDFGPWGGYKGGGTKSTGGGTKSPGGPGSSGTGAKVEYNTLFIRPDIRSKLQWLGMSEAGINALVSGAMITDPNDKAIVADIVAAALQ